MKFSKEALKDKSIIQYKIWTLFIDEMENLSNVLPFVNDIKSCKRIADFLNAHCKHKEELVYMTKKEFSEPFVKCEITYIAPDCAVYNLDIICTLRLWLGKGKTLDTVSIANEIKQALSSYRNNVTTLEKQMQVSDESVKEYLKLSQRINELQGIMPMIMKCDNVGNIEL